ncbi:MAG: class I SAM-dependent methyltransferase [Proteobacteria bacterium]|nr:class I SAM-dependent methyltransferase [Pseudomonadota bacterium]
MNNDEAYAQGLLNAALDPATQPQAIRSFLKAETALLRDLIPHGSQVVDFGCGMGRHLIAIADHIVLGVGFDYQAAYIAEALKLADAPHLHFFVGDATAAPLTMVFDIAVCLTNTWGTMSDKLAVLEEMKRLSPETGTRLITVYAASSVPARSEWYANMGYEVLDTTDQKIVAAGGFTSEHFTEHRLRKLLGPCELHPIGNIAYVIQC